METRTEPRPTHASQASTTGVREVRRVARLLRPLPLFEGVTLDDDAPLDGAFVRSCTAGTVLFTAGEPAESLYVVVLGRVRLVLGADPDGRALAVLGRGDTIGMAALLRGDLYPATAVVVEDALLVGLPAATLRRLTMERPAIAARLVGDISAKLARFVRDIGGFSARSARARVARLLCDLRRDAQGGTDELAFGEPKRVIAQRLAMTPETLSRELHALAAGGLIESRRTRFRVLDAQALERAATDAPPTSAAR